MLLLFGYEGNFECLTCGFLSSKKYHSAPFLEDRSHILGRSFEFDCLRAIWFFSSLWVLPLCFWGSFCWTCVYTLRIHTHSHCPPPKPFVCSWAMSHCVYTPTSCLYDSAPHFFHKILSPPIIESGAGRLCIAAWRHDGCLLHREACPGYSRLSPLHPGLLAHSKCTLNPWNSGFNLWASNNFLKGGAHRPP